MELIRLPTFWKIPMRDGIPISEQFNRLNKKFRFDALFLKEIPSHLLELVVYVCDHEELTAFTKHRTMAILSRLIPQMTSSLSRESPLCDLSATVLTTLLIASKLHDSSALTLDRLHQITRHKYTNKIFTELERRILFTLNYSPSIQGDNPIDWLDLYLQLLSALLPEVAPYDLFFEISAKILDVLYSTSRFFENYELSILVAAVIQATLVVITKHSGRFLLTIRLSNLASVPEEKLLQLASKILKLVLGKEVYEKYDF